MFKRFKDQFTLRLDVDTMERFKSISKDKGVSLQQLFNEAIRTWLLKYDHMNKIESVEEAPNQPRHEGNLQPTIFGGNPIFKNDTTFITLDD